MGREGIGTLGAYRKHDVAEVGMVPSCPNVGL